MSSQTNTGGKKKLRCTLGYSKNPKEGFLPTDVCMHFMKREGAQSTYALTRKDYFLKNAIVAEALILSLCMKNET